MSCPHDGIGLLLAPLSSLCHAHIATAIELARDEGARHAATNLRNILGERGKEHFADGHDFWAAVVVPARERGETSDDEVERWETEFQNGRMLRDPRVQAFCAAWSSTASDLASRAEYKQGLLEDALDGDLSDDALTVHGVGPGRQPVFARGPERFAVFLHDEVRSAVEEVIADSLHNAPAEMLADHSALPLGAEWVIERLQKEYGEQANEALLRMTLDRDLLIDRLIDHHGMSFLLTGQSGDLVEVRGTDEALIFVWEERGR